MKKSALKVYMKIWECKYPLLARIRATREEYESALYDFIHSVQGSTLHGKAIMNANNAHKLLKELNKEAASKIPEKKLKKYQKTLDKYIFICYNKGAKSEEI